MTCPVVNNNNMFPEVKKYILIMFIYIEAKSMSPGEITIRP